jgi:hypothetical protein
MVLTCPNTIGSDGTIGTVPTGIVIFKGSCSAVGVAYATGGGGFGLTILTASIPVCLRLPCRLVC